MTKLVIVLAVVIVVILVVVIVAARNMRAEDPEEFADQFDGRSRARGSRDGRDPEYDHRDPARRPSAPRGGSQGSRPAARPPAARENGAGYRPAGAGRGDRRDQQRGPGYEQRAAPRASESRRRSGDGTPPPDDGWAPPRPRRRPTDSSEWDSSDWEKLSDVDYWVQLASDKSLSATAEPASASAPTQAMTTQPRSAPAPEPETLAAPRSEFAAAPVRADGFQDRKRTPAAPDADRRPAGHRHRPPAGASGDGPDADPPRRTANGTGDRGRPDRQALAREPGERLLDGPNGDRGRYLDVGPASLPLPVIRDVPPRRGRAPDVPPRQDQRRETPPARQDRPRVAPDDDPLTSPSFPKIPADGRSYRNGRPDTPHRNGRPDTPHRDRRADTPHRDRRADTPPGGSRAAASYLAPTQQFSNYEPPAQGYQPPAPGYDAPAPRYADRASPGAYRPDPPASQSPYPYTYPDPDSGASAGPAPATAASNPYGSYVTPESQQTVAAGYNGYPATPGNGHAQSYPPPSAYGATGQDGNGYWQQPPAGNGPGYPNGHGQPGQAQYRPEEYQAGQHDPAGYPPGDHYGSDGYGDYPEYGAAER
jgi:hypothetical protein